MKNNNIVTVSKDSMPALSSLSSGFQAMQEVKKQYEETRNQFVNQLRAVIKDVPSDAPILNRDLARAAGITPLHMAAIINANDSVNIHSTDVTITRRFVEVDENGKPIEGAPIREKQSRLTGYYGKRTGLN